MATRTRPHDPASYLSDDADIAAYLREAVETGDPALIAEAIGDIARAKGMTQVARETGLSRESLYRALSSEGHPEFGTVMKVMKAVGEPTTEEREMVMVRLTKVEWEHIRLCREHVKAGRLSGDSGTSEAGQEADAVGTEGEDCLRQSEG